MRRRSTRLRLPTAEGLRLLAEHLEIPLKDEGVLGRWRLNKPQRRVAKLLEKHPRVVVLKSRQWGCTTLGLLWLIALAIANPHQRFALVLHKQKIAAKKLGELKGFLRQLGVPLLRDNADEVVLSNGAEIVALGADGGEAVGAESNIARGLTFAGALLSDAGYYRNPKVWPAIKAAVGSGPILLEGTARGPEGVLYDKWEQSDDFVKFFSGVEDDPRCRLPADAIDDETWEQLRSEHGFREREVAAWWWKELDGGDVVAMLRDYPVTPDQPFRLSEGRWVQVDPEIVEPVDRLGDIDIWIPPKPGHRYVLACDPSYGLGADYSPVVVLERGARQLCALFYSNTVAPDGQAERIKKLHDLYQPDLDIIEKNGIGNYTVRETLALGIAPMPIHTDESSQLRGLLAAKRAVESGVIYGPQGLLEEAKSLRAKSKPRGGYEFQGRKDLLMAVGFALSWIDDNPWTPPSAQPDPHRVYVPKRRTKAKARV